MFPYSQLLTDTLFPLFIYKYMNSLRFVHKSKTKETFAVSSGVLEKCLRIFFFEYLGHVCACTRTKWFFLNSKKLERRNVSRRPLTTCFKTKSLATLHKVLCCCCCFLALQKKNCSNLRKMWRQVTVSCCCWCFAMFAVYLPETRVFLLVFTSFQM